MSYDAIETSAQGRRPVELYTFLRDYQAWRYTSADRDITVDGAVYLARPLQRGKIEATQESTRLPLTIRAPRDLEVAELYRIAPPTVAVTFILQEFHYGDGELRAQWSGRISAVSFEGSEAVITLEPVFTSMRRIGLRRLYSRTCPHDLYGVQCKVNRENHRVESTADAVSGVTVAVPAASLRPDGYYAGGFIEYPVELGIIERRFISDHVSETLTLTARPYNLDVGAAVKIYPGCDHTMDNCNGRFNNAPNYGGFRHFPQKNPFGSDPVY